MSLASGAQRLAPLTAAATADGSGNATFTFPAIPSTRERWGTLSCPAAPTGALFEFFFGSDGAAAGELVGSWAGPNVWGDIVVVGMLTPIVTATGLTPGKVYGLKWYGYEGPVGSAEIHNPGGIYPRASAVTQPLATITNPGGGLLGYGRYRSTIVTGDPLVFSEDFQTFAYFDGTFTKITPPPNSVTLLIVKFFISETFGTTDPVVLILNVLSHGGAQESDASLFTGALNSSHGDYSATPVGVFFFQSTDAGLPFTIEAAVSNFPSNNPIVLDLLSWPA